MPGQSTSDSVSAPLSQLVGAIDHLTLPVHDLDRAERFYCGLLGAELLFRFDRETFARYRPERLEELESESNSPLHLSLRFGRPGGGTGPRLDLFLQAWGQPEPLQPHPHLAFAVAGADLDSARTLLTEAGIPTAGPLRLGPPGQASLYFLDPFGNQLELVAQDYARPLPIGAPDLRALAHHWGA